MHLATTISLLSLYLNAATALPNPFHRCHTSPTTTRPLDTFKPLPTSDLLAGVLTHASSSEIASISEQSHGDLGGEEPIARWQDRQTQSISYEEDDDDILDGAIVRIRRSLWNLLGWREWVVSIEWRVPPRMKTTFKLKGEGELTDMGWEIEDLGEVMIDAELYEDEETGPVKKGTVDDGMMVDL